MKLERFDGDTFDFEQDSVRLTEQLATVRSILSDGWRYTLAELESMTGYPQNSISARLRDLKKPRFGAHDIQKRWSKLRKVYVYWWEKGSRSRPRRANHTGAAAGGIQMLAVEDLMLDGKRHTIQEMADTLGMPPTSCSASMRKLRDERNGGYYIPSRRLEGGLWDYLLVPDVRGKRNARPKK